MITFIRISESDLLARALKRLLAASDHAAPCHGARDQPACRCAWCEATGLLLDRERLGGAR